MKTNQPPEDNDPLRKTLLRWEVSTSLPPRFEERVWERISRATPHGESSVLGVLRKWLETALPRPAIAASYVAILLLGGVAMGYWRGQEKAGQWRHELASRYVQSVDPYQALASKK